MIQESVVTEVDKDILLADGDDLTCNALHVVLEGNIRIYTMDDQGREVTLYYVNEKEVCINSVAHLFSDVQYRVFARTASKVRILKIPKKSVERDLLRDPRFFKYVVTKIMVKMNDLAKHYQLNVLSSVDTRLKHFLDDRFKKGRHIYITHKDLAQEIGTSREVISRKLKVMEKERKLKLSRGKISM